MPEMINLDAAPTRLDSANLNCFPVNPEMDLAPDALFSTVIARRGINNCTGLFDPQCRIFAASVR